MEKISFTCHMNGRTWEGTINNHKKFSSHHYLDISSHGSGISLYFGAAYLGSWFVCIPDWNAGVLIGPLDDVLYNSEKIGAAMGYEIDGVSVAYALQEFAKLNNMEEQDTTAEIMDILKNGGFKRTD
jgi:hypothetical protein